MHIYARIVKQEQNYRKKRVMASQSNVAYTKNGSAFTVVYPTIGFHDCPRLWFHHSRGSQIAGLQGNPSQDPKALFYINFLISASKYVFPIFPLIARIVFNC